MLKTVSFEKHADRYEAWFEKHRYVYESELEAVKSLLPAEGKGLEIGVGTGQFAKPLGIMIGLDPSKAMLKIAKQKGIDAIGGVAEALPFYDEQFDFVLMVTTICFLNNVQASFKEVYRILKPGGHIIIGFIDQDSPIGQMYQKHKNKSIFYKEAKFWSVNEVIIHLRETGFKNFNFMQTIFHKLSEAYDREPIMNGYGQGSFIVMRGKK